MVTQRQLKSPSHGQAAPGDVTKMKLCNYVTQQVLLLILHILRVLTVADGARSFSVGSEETKQPKAWSASGTQAPEPPSTPLPATEAVIPKRASISKGLATLKLSESSEGRCRGPVYRPKQLSLSAIRDDAHSVGASCDSGFVQQASSLDWNDDNCRPLTRSKDEKILCPGAAGARLQSPPRSPSKSPSFTRASRIPIMHSRSRSPEDSPPSSSISASRESSPTTKSGQSAARPFSSSFSRSSLEQGNSRRGRAAVSNLHTSPEQSGVLHSATRRCPNTFPPAAWRNRQKGGQQNLMTTKPFLVMNEFSVTSGSSAEEKVHKSPTAAGTRSRSKSLTAGESDSEHQRESIPHVRGEEAGVGLRETVVQEGMPDSTMPTWTGRMSVKANIQSFDVPPDPPRLITRLRRRAAVSLLDETKFLLNQSVEQSYGDLFNIVTPDLVSIARSLSTMASSVLSHEDVLTAQIVYNMFSRKKFLNVGPLGKRRPAPHEYMTLRAVPERLLGVGGASIVYQMRLAGVTKEEHGDKWAVKVHYGWVHENTSNKSFSALRSMTQDIVMAVSHSLSRDYTPSVLFSKFHFLVPYFFGEVSGLEPVLLPHHSDSQKFLLNLVTIMPVMPGSFDSVLSTKELSPAAKRSVCLSFVELVARLHLQMLVHGDLKPANFFLSAGGQVYLGDFDTIGWQNGMRRCGAMATVDFLDPVEAECHIQSPDRIIPMTTARDAWSLGLCLFLVWCGAFPFDVLNKKATLSSREFVGRLRALTPNRTGGDSTTPKLEFQSCPGGMIADGLVLELIQRFLELDRNKRWTPVTGYKFILGAGVSVREAVQPVFF